jgi:hypothetical protein
VTTISRAASVATAAAALVALVLTLVRGLPDSLAVLDSERGRFAAMPDEQRHQAFGLLIPTRMDIFDFYRRGLRRDDRFYIQVVDQPLGIASKGTVVRSVARYYLAPAVEVEDPEEATVILSYDSDPAQLRLRYSEQIQAGEQLIFVSRVAR